VVTTEIDWTVVSYFVIGLFALSGFLKGWWKEAVTAFFLGILVFLLVNPTAAQWVIDGINNVLEIFWGWLPASLKNLLSTNLGIDSFELDASSGQTWLAILIILLGFSITISRVFLSNRIRDAESFAAYALTPLGSLLGGLLGGLNGFLIINLVREYLDGRNLPSGTEPLPTEIAAAGSQSVSVASPGVGFVATDVPTISNLSEVLGWIVVGLGLLMLLLVLKYMKSPVGYKGWDIEKKEDDFIIVPAIIPVKKSNN